LKKIVIAVNDSWAAYNFRFNLGLALQKEGYEVTFISPYSSYSEKIKFFFNYSDIKLSANGINPIEDFKTIYGYYKIYKELRPSVVLNFSIKPNIYGTFAASFLGIPVINNIAGLGTLFIEQGAVTKIAEFLYKLSQKRAAKIFFQNSEDFNVFVGKNLVEKDRCDVLPGSGVDVEKFSPMPKVNNGVFIFLLISRMLWTKGIKEFVDAAKIIRERHNDVEFWLLGYLDVQNPTSIPKEQMAKWVKDGNVNYLGSSDNVRAEIAKADCMVLPSFYREGTPRVLLESASMAKPIITTDNVGCRDVVDDGVNGYLCEVKNVEDLTNKMEMMINLTDAEREVMGKFGREKILRKFDEKIVIKKYLDSVMELAK
jgi:glycosyltransferase involved in cell wall biosynthesis